MCQGSVGCATSIQEFLSCWLFKRDAPHCGLVCSWDNKAMKGAASEEGLCLHTAPPSLFPFFALNQFTHTHTHLSIYISTQQSQILSQPCGWRSLRAAGFCRATLQGRGHKTKALVTWKNSCNLQEEVEHLRDDVWILSVLFWAKCQSWGGCCWLMVPPSTTTAALHKSTPPPSHHHYAFLSTRNVLPVPYQTVVSQWPVRPQ